MVDVPRPEGTHGGADRLLVEEFLRFAVQGGPTATSPVAAREAVAAGHAATRSLRAGGVPVAVRPLPADLVGYYDRGQTSSQAAIPGQGVRSEEGGGDDNGR